MQRAGVPVADSAHVHLMFRASLEGVCVRGPMIGRQHAYVLARDWLPAVAAGAALGGAGRAGPALPGRPRTGRRPRPGPLGRPAAARRARGAGGDRSRAGAAPRRTGGAALGPPAPRPLPPPRLLGTFEPILLGWRSREALLGDDPQVIVNGGMFSQFAIVEGRGVAGWRLRDGRVEIKPWAPVTRGPGGVGARRRRGAGVPRARLAGARDARERRGTASACRNRDGPGPPLPG